MEKCLPLEYYRTISKDIIQSKKVHAIHSEYNGYN